MPGAAPLLGHHRCRGSRARPAARRAPSGMVVLAIDLGGAAAATSRVANSRAVSRISFCSVGQLEVHAPFHRTARRASRGRPPCPPSDRAVANSAAKRSRSSASACVERLVGSRARRDRLLRRRDRERRRCAAICAGERAAPAASARPARTTALHEADAQRLVGVDDVAGDASARRALRDADAPRRAAACRRSPG